ncbi:hypothetical protein [Streptomyces sp. V3I7]|uniref:hypothetical protein n=1 Tax=Streptomyces sp. V3I7 TaxID=3042278 RepID=UPI0027828069|nr:hypothetical protein [Streptomyces sp. V3I7]MDQ0994798.1 hypothetical protein [Streptomyces sp. V3I7]
MTMMPTERILDLAAAAATASDEDLVPLLREANEVYQQGFEEMRPGVEARFAASSDAELTAAARAAGVFCDTNLERGELLLMLALSEWEMTPAAIAYAEMAGDAARRGVCLLPQE